jgi:hypothetical protein
MKITAYVAKKIKLEVDDKFETLLDSFSCDVANELVEAIDNKDAEVVEVLTVWDETDSHQLI